jgi:hypothetical protein
MERLKYGCTFVLVMLLCGCLCANKPADSLPVTRAKEELHRRGWKTMEVFRVNRAGDNWVVHLYRRPIKMIDAYAVVTVSPEGSILDVSMDDK